MYVQLYEQLRDLILRRVLRREERLPSSRLMAAELGVSRATVIAAYDQLVGEGYIAGRAGSGMYVCPLPEETFDRFRRGCRARLLPLPRRRVAARGKRCPAGRRRFSRGSLTVVCSPPQSGAGHWREAGAARPPGCWGMGKRCSGIRPYSRHWRGIYRCGGGLM